jgi:hypothetical protein
MPDHIADARTLIENRLAQIDAEKESLERAIAALGERSSRRPGRSSTSTPQKPKGRTSPVRSRRSGRRLP